MVTHLFKRWYGDFSREEIKKYALLGLTFGVLITAYWGLRPIKDSIFMSIVGINYQPYAKMLSLVAVLGLIGIYGKLVDWLPRHKVFYILTATYALAALLFALILSNPHYGIPNTVASPTRIIGWLWYIYAESIGTMIVPLFWAFTADVSTADSAKRGFPLIMLCAQFGNIVGPFFLRATRLGFINSAPVIGIAGILLFIVGILIWTFMRITPPSEFHATASSEKEKPGLLEGFKLLVTNGYLLGIFVFLLAFETINTMLEFYFKAKVNEAFPSEALVSDYLANFAVFAGLISFFSLIFGISSIQRILGMRASLITLPLLMGAGIVVWWLNPVMIVSGIISVIFKGLNYALNQPSIKQLYIPTSKDTRYKAQAWIEVFGSRGSKAVGSTINTSKLALTKAFGPAAGLPMYLSIACITSFGLLGIWVLMAFYVANKYNKAIKEEKLVC